MYHLLATNVHIYKLHISLKKLSLDMLNLLIKLSLEILNRIQYKVRITNYVLLNATLMKTA